MINYPYSAVTYATTSETRLNDIRFFSMITTCKLFNCARSDNNPHGFLYRGLPGYPDKTSTNNYKMKNIQELISAFLKR